MGIFFRQRHRLERESWRGEQGAERLAKEILSIFSIQEVEFDGPVTIGPNPDEPGNTTPPLTLVTPTGGTGDAITIRRGDTTTGSISTTGGSSGDTIINSVFPPAPSDTLALQSFPVTGFVVSGGPGSTYTVQVFPYGATGTSYNVTVEQQEIAVDETIPAGTAVVVIVYPRRVGNSVVATYEMQVPVYLTDA